MNVEVRRIATHIRDEDVYLRAQEDLIHPVNPHLAHQIGVYRMVRGRFNTHHIRRIRQIARLTGFTGTASVGVAVVSMGGGIEAAVEQNNGHGGDDAAGSRELLDLQEEQEETEEEEELERDIIDILTVSMDHVQLRQ